MGVDKAIIIHLLIFIIMKIGWMMTRKMKEMTMLRPFKGRISQKIPTGHNLFAMPSIFSAIDDDDKNHDCDVVMMRTC